MTNNKIGVLLVHLGTPDAPTPAAVRRYLREFLSDPRVIQTPRWLWWLILNGIILRIRPKPVAKLYASVWTEQGSPLRMLAERQAAALQQQFDACGVNARVALGMTYGNPSVVSGLLALRAEGVSRVLVVPMYPQYSATTTAAVFDAVARALKPCPSLPELRFVRDWHVDRDYIEALAQSVEAHRAERPFERLMMSFHGIPQRYADKGDPYPKQCHATAEALAKRLGLSDEQWICSFQSRFGREPWLMPYTDKTLEQWAQQGVKRIAVICPGFAVDCLETLEEIAEQNRELFEHAGGEALHYIAALNDRPAHIQLLSNMCQRQMLGW